MTIANSNLLCIPKQLGEMIGNALCIRKEDMGGSGYTDYLDSIITYFIHVSSITLYSTYTLLKNRVKIAIL